MKIPKQNNVSVKRLAEKKTVLKSRKYRVSIPYLNPAPATDKNFVGASASGEKLSSKEQLSQERVVVLSPDACAAVAFANSEKGSERLVLERVADAAVHGHSVSAELQKIANLLLADALRQGKLPDKVDGRPALSSKAILKKVELAYRHFELLDRRKADQLNKRNARLRGDGKAMPLDEVKGSTAQKVAKKLGSSTRDVERAAKEYEWLFGLSSEDRDAFRAWRSCLGDENAYGARILYELRYRQGLPASGPSAAPSVRFAQAIALVAGLRMKLSELINGAEFRPPTTKDFEAD